MKMKYINKNNFKLLCLGLLTLAAPACTDDFEGLNVDKGRISDADLAKDGAEAAFLLPIMMNNIVVTGTGVQTQQNLQAESYAGYLEAPTAFIGNVNTMTYSTKGIWAGSYDASTNNVMNNWLTMQKKGYDVKYPDLYAIGLILKGMAGQRLTDTFGPYPYSKFGNTAEPKFDSPAEVYAGIFADLEKAVAALLAAEKADPAADTKRFAKWDRSTFKGDYLKWVKLANTIRLRMAMRISVVDPAKGKAEADKALLPANGGVMDLSTGSFQVAASATAVNPYFTMTNAWSDTRMSAAIITYLDGFKDSRLAVYANPATHAPIAGTFRGIRPGIEKPADKKPYINYSTFKVAEFAPVKIVDGAESYFLKAEGALRGWNVGGTAQSLYEEGIRASFTLNGAGGVDAYLNSTSTQAAYVDPANASLNSEPLTSNTVKWDEAGSFDNKLEKIITQKWIALFPEGTEAWSEFRRTGYPAQYAIAFPTNPRLPKGTFIKRLTYPNLVASSSKAAYDAAVTAYLQGKDEPDIKFYWMK